MVCETSDIGKVPIYFGGWNIILCVCMGSVWTVYVLMEWFNASECLLLSKDLSCPWCRLDYLQVWSLVLIPYYLQFSHPALGQCQFWFKLYRIRAFFLKRVVCPNKIKMTIPHRVVINNCSKVITIRKFGNKARSKARISNTDRSYFSS